MCAIPLHSIRTVSYTHLDVYKRQGWGRGGGGEEGKGDEEDDEEGGGGEGEEGQHEGKGILRMK